MLTYNEFIEKFSLFEHNIPILKIGTYSSCHIDNGIRLSQHKLLSVKYYQRIYISLWLDGLDTRTNEILDQHGGIVCDMKIDDNIKRFIKFRYHDVDHGGYFVFDWPGGDAEFELIGNAYWTNNDNYYNDNYYNDCHMETIMHRFLDVIINRNPKYFTNKYKLK